MSICPDPSALAGIDAAAPAPARDAVFDMRAGAVASAQLLYYRHPPRMVRGCRHRLYDEDGRPYLDMVNNVAVLGHSHPAVAAAAQRALRLLNTNSGSSTTAWHGSPRGLPSCYPIRSLVCSW